jgi:quinol-cytochrome oxidoreductase complex cytochrome b subunit
LIEFLKKKSEKKISHLKKKEDMNPYYTALIIFGVMIVLMVFSMFLWMCYQDTNERNQTNGSNDCSTDDEVA